MESFPATLPVAPFFLASAPVSVLDDAKRLVESRGGYYAAGDKDDIFNSMTLGDQESWKVGWKGKVEMLINILKKQHPGQKVTALAIAGGPACDWERGELHNTFCKNHRGVLVLKQLGDIDDLQAWLDKCHPVAESGAPKSSVMVRDKPPPEPHSQLFTTSSPPEEVNQCKNFRGPCAVCCMLLAPCYCVSADGETVFCCVPTKPYYLLPGCLHMVLCPQQGCDPLGSLLDSNRYPDPCEMVFMAFVEFYALTINANVCLYCFQNPAHFDLENCRWEFKEENAAW